MNCCRGRAFALSPSLNLTLHNGLLWTGWDFWNNTTRWIARQCVWYCGDRAKNSDQANPQDGMTHDPLKAEG